MIPTEIENEEIGHCVGHAAPDIFFAEPGTFTEGVAARICGTCPIAAQCANGAFERGEEYGIWGGINFEDKYARGWMSRGKTWSKSNDCL